VADLVRDRFPDIVRGRRGAGRPACRRGLDRTAHTRRVGADGAVFVSDHGDSHQVKVFAANGGLTTTFGMHGRPVAGHNSPAPDRPGMLIAPTRLLGWFFFHRPVPTPARCGA
jgi:hypothetical protein